MAEVLHVKSADFDALIQGETPVLVDFWATWCGPCRMLAPILEELQDKSGARLTVAKVNVDEETDLAARFGVMSIPTLLLFKKGELLERSVGLKPLASLEEMVQAYI